VHKQLDLIFVESKSQKGVGVDVSIIFVSPPHTNAHILTPSSASLHQLSFFVANGKINYKLTRYNKKKPN
jgi:hypothetical protein